MSDVDDVALSLRQPWATLLVYGVKKIEIRTWPTRKRGKIFIHASTVVDRREEATALARQLLVTEKMRETAQLRGGIIGVAQLTECVEYRTLEEFKADWAGHRNAPAWFEEPVLFGFKFADAHALPFCRYTGQTFFFRVRLAARQGSREPLTEHSP
jgi:hypothetical protein